MTHWDVPPTVSCPRCGAPNRVDAARVREGLQPVCGRCRAPLRAPSGVVEVTDSRFEEQVLASPLPVLLDVWAPWCVPCRGMEPVVEELAASLAGKVRVAKLNVDLNPEAAARLRIMGVPTLIVFKDGQEVTRMVGAREKGEVMRSLVGVA
ncbi:MAG TPA: thioredoxin [Vicinamibacteria bacterium]|nr:thioredoxin [Vicinamibacteria bacterium]